MPSFPAICLHLATPTSGLGRLVTGGSPYWAYCWGGGLALAHYIVDNPQRVRDRTVLDLGAGSGLVAIAAAQAGAEQVIAAEIDPWAVAALNLNIAANGASIAIISNDLLEGPPPPVDLVLVGDLFYEAGLAKRVTAFLDRCVSAGVTVLVGDPWRDSLPRRRLRLLAGYSVPDFAAGGANGRVRGAVFSFESLLP